MTATSKALKEIFTAARPLIEQWLDVAEQMAAIRDTASAKGLDWSQIKALLKAQVQDERDGKGDGRRVKRIVDKAEFASAYADMLGLVNMNEENFSLETHSTAAIEPHAVDSAGAGVAAASSVPASHFVPDDLDTSHLTASRSTPADGSGFHDPETGEVFEPMTEAELLRQLEAAPETEHPLTEAPPSPSPSVIEEGGAAASAPPSEPFDDECETVFEFHAEISAEQAKAQLAAMREGPGEMPDFLRRNKQQAVA